MMLQDAPGGAALIAALADAAKSFALVYAGTSDMRASEHLDGYLRLIEPTLVDAVGHKSTARILEAMRRAVMTYKAELEGAPASGALH